MIEQAGGTLPGYQTDSAASGMRKRDDQGKTAISPAYLSLFTDQSNRLVTYMYAPLYQLSLDLS